MSDVVSLQERLGAMLNFEVVVILSKPLPPEEKRSEANWFA